MINALACGGDVLGIMPTGAGKSLCYQVPALLLPGVTLVVSPLISLMRDQVQALTANGIPAAFINSSLTEGQWNRVMAAARSRQYKIIYIAPERLLAPSMLELAQSLPISLLAVDEAHCISQWGQDFRPSYLDIPQFAEALPVRPAIAAFTATATVRVREDILQTLGLQNPLTLVTGFDRPNLYFEVQQPKDKYAALTQYLQENTGNGIVYCSTRKEVEEVTERLLADGHSAARYHAGLSAEERSRSQDDFLYDRSKIIVATNAFGMGIDKSNVRFVIHYNMPQNVESYYQEAGRAGRDGLASDCILYYARKDINTALFLINQSENPEEIIRNKHLLYQMERYCETDGCLRRYMLQYFGEESEDDCGSCGNCNGNFVETDVTLDAKKVLSHITRLNKAGKRFMFTHTADILLGKSEDFRELSTFGIMKGMNYRYIRQIISRLTVSGYVYDDGFLSVTEKAKEVLFGDAAVTIRGSKPELSAREKRKRMQSDAPHYAFSQELFAKLKELRLALAAQAKVPAFVIFSDATLTDMCRKQPRTAEELLAVSGVGQVKLERYGEQFLQLLCQTEKSVRQDGDAQEKAEKLTAQMLTQQVEIEDSPLQISRIADNLSAVLMQYGKSGISGVTLNSLLMEAGFLKAANGVRLPTDSGRVLGITTVQRQSSRGEYTQCLFGANAQKQCVELVMQALEADCV